MKKIKRLVKVSINLILLPFRIRVIRIMRLIEKDKRIPFDYIRFATLRLMAAEIEERKLTGDVAELGVWRGDFAKHINMLFPNRKLYLFDTFEGFDSRDVSIDISSSYSDGTQNFANTSVNLVLNKMPYPAQCEIIKGYFPDSLSDLPLQETLRFCFVSIDVDLYKPIYEGLCYFYPKLCKGGYILLHDYNEFTYKGVKAAVHQFAKENAISYVPIPDESGSVVIAKPLT